MDTVISKMATLIILICQYLYPSEFKVKVFLNFWLHGRASLSFFSLV